MSSIVEKSLVIRKETIYEKIRKSLFALIYKKDYQMIQKLDNLMQVKKPSKKIIIPKEIGSTILKYDERKSK